MRKLTRTLHSLPRENDALDSCPGCKTLANTCEQRRGEHVFLFSLSLRDDPTRYSGVKGWPQYQNRSSGGKSNEDLLNPSSLSVNVVHVSYATFENRNVDFSVKLRTSISTFLGLNTYVVYTIFWKFIGTAMGHDVAMNDDDDISQGNQCEYVCATWNIFSKRMKWPSEYRVSLIHIYRDMYNFMC